MPHMELLIKSEEYLCFNNQNPCAVPSSLNYRHGLESASRMGRGWRQTSALEMPRNCKRCGADTVRAQVTYTSCSSLSRCFRKVPGTKSERISRMIAYLSMTSHTICVQLYLLPHNHCQSRYRAVQKLEVFTFQLFQKNAIVRTFSRMP